MFSRLPLLQQPQYNVVHKGRDERRQSKNVAYDGAKLNHMENRIALLRNLYLDRADVKKTEKMPGSDDPSVVQSESSDGLIDGAIWVIGEM